MKGQRQAHSSIARGDDNARDDWRTPAVVLDRVRRLGLIRLDPCGNLDNSTGAETVYSGPDGNGLDGLAESWALGGLAFANYPYSEGLTWATKWTAEAAKGTPIIVLGPARFDTRWHRLAAATASAVGCWRGRLTFVGAPAPAPFPSVLFFYNLDLGDIARVFGEVVDVYTLINAPAPPRSTPKSLRELVLARLR